MQRFGLLGTSFNDTPLDRLENLVIPEESRRETLLQLRGQLELSELVYLATCNRVEFTYLAREDLPSEATESRLRRLFNDLNGSLTLYHYGGTDAIRHLFSVAASLNSMLVGEVQILGQVKEAFQGAKTWGLCGPHLEELFSWAFRVAKKVRRETSLGEGTVSIANLILDEILPACQNDNGRKVVLVGVGEMTVKLARLLMERGHKNLHFVNRTGQKAAGLAKQFGGSHQSLAEYLASPVTTSILVSATSATEPIFNVQTVQPLLNSHPVLMVDLAVPKDIDSDVASLPNVTVRRLEDFRAKAKENLAARQKEVARGMEIVEREAERFWERFVENEKLGYLRHASVFDLVI